MTVPQSGLKAHRMKSLFILRIQRLSEFRGPFQILTQLRAGWGCTRRMYIVEANFDGPEQLRTKLTCGFMRLKSAKVSRWICTSTISGIVFETTGCSFDNLKQA